MINKQPVDSKTRTLNIVADENIPGLEQTFDTLGQVTRLPGRTMTAKDVQDADVLIVRSVTPVNEQLLENSSVKFVGTCTIGTDHLDTAYLNHRGILWSNAPGCNANSVVEYVFAALAALKVNFLRSSVGVIACGNVGGAVYRKLIDLDVDVCVYDPLVSSDTAEHLVSLDDVLACDIVTVHAPLTRDGSNPSFHLLGEKQLAQLKPNACLISAGRGAVIDNDALLKLLATRSDLQVALDVWEEEPSVNMGLMSAVNLATPHIAGYSFDGKVKGTDMIYQRVLEAFNLDSVQSKQQMTDAGLSLTLNESGSWLDALHELICQAYDIQADDQRMRETLAACSDEMARRESFDLLRKNYPKRREFFNYSVDVSLLSDLQAEKKPLSNLLVALGFKVST